MFANNSERAHEKKIQEMPRINKCRNVALQVSRIALQCEMQLCQENVDKNLRLRVYGRRFMV